MVGAVGDLLVDVDCASTAVEQTIPKITSIAIDVFRIMRSSDVEPVIGASSFGSVALSSSAEMVGQQEPRLSGVQVP